MHPSPSRRSCSDAVIRRGSGERDDGSGMQRQLGQNIRVVCSHGSGSTCFAVQCSTAQYRGLAGWLAGSDAAAACAWAAAAEAVTSSSPHDTAEAGWRERLAAERLGVFLGALAAKGIRSACLPAGLQALHGSRGTRTWLTCVRPVAPSHASLARRHSCSSSWLKETRISGNGAGCSA